jgi:hypothetical protein
VRVVRAYSGVVAGSQDWKKVEIEVNEEDLASLLDQAEIELPREKVSTAHAFALLTSEVELLMLKSMIVSFKLSKEQLQDDIDNMKNQKEQILTILKGIANG